MFIYKVTPNPHDYISHGQFNLNILAVNPSRTCEAQLHLHSRYQSPRRTRNYPKFRQIDW